MVINTNNDLTSNNTSSSRQKAGNVNATADKAASTTNSSASDSSSVDSVQLSVESQLLKRLEAKIQQAPEIDTPKVEAIKTAISNGEYTINVERIAEKLLQSDNFLG